jgi:hypothetical protein
LTFIFLIIARTVKMARKKLKLQEVKYRGLILVCRV